MHNFVNLVFCVVVQQLHLYITQRAIFKVKFITYNVRGHEKKKNIFFKNWMAKYYCNYVRLTFLIIPLILIKWNNINIINKSIIKKSIWVKFIEKSSSLIELSEWASPLDRPHKPAQKALDFEGPHCYGLIRGGPISGVWRYKGNLITKSFFFCF